MAKTLSNMMPLGTIAPSFELPDVVTGKHITLNDIRSDTATVVMFICNHCPFVQLILNKLVQVAKDYQSKGIQFVAISANDISHYPDDSPDKMRDLANKMKFTFPYLYDESQSVAKAYQAACTPDIFVFDQQLACVYRGRFDNATPGNGETVTGIDLTRALDAIIANQTVDQDQHPSVGCNIKWKS